MKKQTQKTKSIALMGILTALLILMAFTPIGYLKVGAISISFLMIPVVIGAIALGPWAGAALGGVFGITSFVQCFGMDVFGTFLMDINPFATFIMCVGARVLAGFCAGLIAAAFKKSADTLHGNHRPGTALALRFAGYSVTGLCGALFNTLFFMGSLLLFFWKSTTFIEKMQEWGFDTSAIGKFFAAFVGTNAIVEAIAAFVIIGAISSALYRARLIDALAIEKTKQVPNDEAVADIEEKIERIEEASKAD
ncbi:MAG: ECF transporter S component [Clostridiales bacterium]|nr:ECF transporter S component [Clostridiales bacterium]